MNCGKRNRYSSSHASVCQRWRSANSAAISSSAASADRPGEVVQRVVHSAGFVEPHTPGSGAPEEMPASSGLAALLGAPVDLNRVTTVRTRWRGPGRSAARPPRAILILIPGFLGGATTFDPLARDLVNAVGSRLEVWAVDRRPNQLEDQLGGRHAQVGMLRGEPEALAEGAQFYFPDTDNEPLGDFPGPGDFDDFSRHVLGPGVLDPKRDFDFGQECLRIFGVSVAV